jgi:hypothetical protein
MLSTELPVHQISKQGGVDIRIIRRADPHGQITMQWKVEPNLALGQPGQLAYHLDTWIINRRLDHLPRPIPRLIRLGDLREIARELGFGGDTNSVKRAFEQNATAFIRAKVEYKRRDGTRDTLEGYFNRYNLIYRGQTLPGGARAETVYLSLNDPYYGLVNNSTRRPLDYRYLRSLTPGAQRLYELLSPRIFAAIKNGHPSAWIRYSEFCVLAVARRQNTRRRMQTQMLAIHRPHLESGYLQAVSWHAEATDDGAQDWTIRYVPGPRAQAEFEAFNGAGFREREPRGDERNTSVLPYRTKPVSSGRLEGVSTVSPAESVARRFLEKRTGSPDPFVSRNQLIKADQILQATNGDVATALRAVDSAAAEGRRNRNGFPRHLAGVLEGGFVDRARALALEERQRADAEQRRRHDEHDRERYRSWSADRAAERIAVLSAEERITLVDERLPRYVEEHEFYLRQRGMNSDRIREWAAPRVLDRYGHEGEPSFEEWRRQHGAQPTSSLGPQEALQ